MSVTAIPTSTPRNVRPHRRPSPRHARSRRQETPTEVTLSIVVTVAGDQPHRDALDVIDGLRQLAYGVGATLEIAEAPTGQRPESGPARGSWTHLAAGQPTVVAPAALSAAGRARAVRRLVAASTDPTMLVLHPGTRVVRRQGSEIALSRIEYDLLAFLVDHPQQVFTRRQLLTHVWGDEGAGRRTVDVHVSRLRAKLGADLVTTTRGVGYRLADGAPIEVIHHLHPNGDVL